jgi:hypothetical protein
MSIPQRQYIPTKDTDRVKVPQPELEFKEADGSPFRFSEGHSGKSSPLVDPHKEFEFLTPVIWLRIEVVSLAILGDTVALIDYTVARLQTQTRGLCGESVDMGPHEGAEVQNSR